MKFRWLVIVHDQSSSHEIWGEKWKNEWEIHNKEILQYSLDGETWYDVEYFYVNAKDIPEGEKHRIEIDSTVRNNKVIKLK